MLSQSFIEHPPSESSPNEKSHQVIVNLLPASMILSIPLSVKGRIEGLLRILRLLLLLAEELAGHIPKVGSASGSSFVFVFLLLGVVLGEGT